MNCFALWVGAVNKIWAIRGAPTKCWGSQFWFYRLNGAQVFKISCLFLIWNCAWDTLEIFKLLELAKLMCFHDIYQLPSLSLQEYDITTIRLRETVWDIHSDRNGEIELQKGTKHFKPWFGEALISTFQPPDIPKVFTCPWHLNSTRLLVSCSIIRMSISQGLPGLRDIIRRKPIMRFAEIVLFDEPLKSRHYLIAKILPFRFVPTFFLW